MDDKRLAAADAAYAKGDFEGAAATYLEAAEEAAGGKGALLHLAGNALMKLKRFEEAADAYRRASVDEAYDRRSAVLVNLGSALSALNRNAEAIEAYDAALDDETYATPHKALQGRAAALYALGNYDEAAAAYRQAAWADGNTDPGKALNNLGLSFMALGKPQDAIEAFKAALSIEGYAAKGKAAVNLALAYAAMGFFEEAVLSFESARDTYGHTLTGDTLRAYEEAREAAAEGDDREVEVPAEDFESEIVEGWETGEILPSASATSQAPVLPDTDDEQTAKFFNMTEDEMRDVDRAARKEKRAEQRTPKSVALRVGAIVAAVLVIAGGVFALLYFGFGYPTQEQTVTGLIDAYRQGESYTQFWVAVPTADVKEEMRALPAKFSSYAISGVDRAATRSTAVVAIKLESGSTLSYEVQLAREGVGWKVVGIKNRWQSTED